MEGDQRQSRKDTIQMSNETLDQQTKDSDMVFTAISTGAFDSFEEANRAVVMFYVTDMSVSRAGISHALKRLERHYASAGRRQTP